MGSARRAQEDRATRSEADSDHPSPAHRHTATRRRAPPGSASGAGCRAGMGTMGAWERFSSRLLVATAPASNERWTPSSERSSCTAGPSTSASRSSTTSTWCATWNGRAPSSWTSWTRCRRQRSWSCRRTARPRRSTHEAASRRLELIDATCPLVTKVHLEARRFAEDDRTIILIGHAGHEEVEGTSGQAPDRTILVQSIEEAERVEVPDPSRLSYLTQTTLSVDETNQIVDALRSRFPEIQGPPSRGHLLRNAEPPGRGEGGRPPG